MLFPSPGARQDRIAELESEVIYLRHMIDVTGEPEIRNLAASLIALLVARLVLLKAER